MVTENGSTTAPTTSTAHRTVLCTTARHQRNRPHTPEHNGEVELYIRTLAGEVLHTTDWTSEAQCTTAFGA